MEHTKSFRSRYYIKPYFIFWTLVILFIGDIFFSKYVSDNYRQSSEIILTCIYFLLFLCTIFYFFYNSIDRDILIKNITKLKKEKEQELKLNDYYKDELKLFEYELDLIIISDSNFLYRLKTKEELTSISNIGNYIIILIILFLSQSSFDYIKPIGSAVFMALIVISIIYCIWILLWQFIKKKTYISPITIGHVLAIYFLFNWGKNSYIRSYGDEILGSYFEKSEYRTKYYVNIFPDRESGENFRLPADIHVYSDEQGEETGENYVSTYTTKYIVVEKVYLPEGGYLDFEDCQIEINDKVLCTDQNKKKWYIELTKEKVK